VERAADGGRRVPSKVPPTLACCRADYRQRTGRVTTPTHSSRPRVHSSFFATPR